MAGAGSGPLLGREAEVAQAVQVLTSDGGGCVAVVGAAGIGKSAVVAEVGDRLAAGGATVRTTAGAVSESDLPFVGLHDLVADELTAGAVDLPAPLQEAVDVAVLRRRGIDADVDPVALDLAVLRVVEHLSAPRRLVLVLDDLPWVDAATRSTLAFVLRRLAPDRVSTLVAMRPEAPGIDIVAPAAVRTLDLGPLDPTTLVAAVTARLGTRLPHRLAALLHDASGGNPLLALEVARTAMTADPTATSALGGRDLPVPERYRTILAPRLECLSPDARRALLAASLLSRPTLEQLADVVTIDGLLEAEAAGVVRLDGGRVAFAHPLFASLCREAATSGERRHVHALLAKAAPDEIERARHLGAAALLPDEGVAAEIEGTAERARGRAAVAAAADLMLLAVRVTPAGDLDRRTSRACAAAGLFLESGDVETAAAVLQPLIGDLEPGAARARSLVTLARVTSEDTEGAADLFREALAQPGLDADTEYDARFEVANTSAVLGDFAGSAAMVAALEADATEAGRVDVARTCRAHSAWLDLMRGTPTAHSAAWRRMVEEAAAYEFEYDHPDLLQAWDAMAREDNARAVALIEALTERARREGSFHLWGMLAQHLADAELRRGNIAAACDLVDRAYRVCADGSRDESVLYFRAIVRAWSGRLDEARTDAANGLAMARRVHNSLFELPCRHALGFVALSAGDSAAAAAHYGAVAAGMRAMGWRHPGLMMWHGNAVEAFVGAGRRAEAVDLTEDLAALAERLDLTTCAAVALRCRGLVREDAGDLEAAAAALDESVRLSEPLDNPLEHARTLLVRGVVQRRRRQKARSREDLGRACEIFTRHGATVWAARAARELERSLPAAAGGELTGAERAVAELAAAGATNREIAAELYLSEKTVEAVLTRVYRKLAVRSRTQLGHHPELRHAAEGRR